MKVQANQAAEPIVDPAALEALHDAAQELGHASATAADLKSAVATWAQHADDPAALKLASSLEALASSIGKTVARLGKAVGAPKTTAPKLPGTIKKAHAAPSTKPKAAGKAAKTHVVRKGDTLWGISQRAGVSLKALIAANPQIADPDLIHPGEKVKIPKGGAAPAPASGHDRAPAAPSGGHGHAPVHQGGSGAAPVGGSGVKDMSARARKEMASLLAHAKANSGGKRPLGWCLREVQDILDRTTFGKIGHGKTPRFNYAHDFADWLNAGHRWKSMGLKRLDIDNPYKAPPGAIVVVRAGTPGTHHPKAGDIAIAAGNGRFLNDGEMGYGGSHNFKPGNNYVLGVYVPA